MFGLGVYGKFCNPLLPSLIHFEHGASTYLCGRKFYQLLNYVADYVVLKKVNIQQLLEIGTSCRSFITSTVVHCIKPACFTAVFTCIGSLL